MGKVDFNLPLETTGVILKQVPMPQGMAMQAMEYRVCIPWEEIIGLEQFIEVWMYPGDTREKVNIVVRGRGAYTILASFDEIMENWFEYKQWKAKGLSNVFKN